MPSRVTDPRPPASPALPTLPIAECVTYYDLPAGRIRTRRMGVPQPGVPPIVAVMGMAVANYFMPTLAALAEWTETHLVELPGFGGSDEPRYEPDARGYGETARGLAESAPDGRFLSLRGPHNFLWADPEAWSEPVRNFARQVAVIPKDGT
jgi:hypothetical protein